MQIDRRINMMKRAVIALCIVCGAMPASGCHPGYASYSLNYGTPYCGEPVYCEPVYCEPVHYHGRHGHHGRW